MQYAFYENLRCSTEFSGQLNTADLGKNYLPSLLQLAVISYLQYEVRPYFLEYLLVESHQALAIHFVSHACPPGTTVADIEGVEATLNISERTMLVLLQQDLKNYAYNSTVYTDYLIRVELSSKANDAAVIANKEANAIKAATEATAIAISAQSAGDASDLLSESNKLISKSEAATIRKKLAAYEANAAKTLATINSDLKGKGAGKKTRGNKNTKPAPSHANNRKHQPAKSAKKWGKQPRKSTPKVSKISRKQDATQQPASRRQQKEKRVQKAQQAQRLQRFEQETSSLENESRNKSTLSSKNQRSRQRQIKRHQQQHLAKERNEINRHTSQLITTRILKTRRFCFNKYGFAANPRKSLQQNIDIAHQSIPPHLLWTTPKNLSYHNLCNSENPPPLTTMLLGLGLKFCVQTRQPPRQLNTAIQRLKRDVRLRYQYHNDTDTTSLDTYNPNLYLANKNFRPEIASEEIERALADFENRLTKIIYTRKSKSQSNLTPIQKGILETPHHSSTTFKIVPTDKNLGPAVMNRSQYM